MSDLIHEIVGSLSHVGRTHLERSWFCWTLGLAITCARRTSGLDHCLSSFRHVLLWSQKRAVWKIDFFVLRAVKGDGWKKILSIANVIQAGKRASFRAK